jgi:hypothetical protein
MNNDFNKLKKKVKDEILDNFDIFKIKKINISDIDNTLLQKFYNENINNKDIDLSISSQYSYSQCQI